MEYIWAYNSTNNYESSKLCESARVGNDAMRLRHYWLRLGRCMIKCNRWDHTAEILLVDYDTVDATATMIYGTVDNTHADTSMNYMIKDGQILNTFLKQIDECGYWMDRTL